jgi:DNA ligase (NAD+)
MKQFAYRVVAAATFACAVAVVGTTAAEPAAGAQDKVAALRAEIARHDELYHRRATPEISDADYDGLKRRLGELERAFPEAARAVPPRAEVGDDRSGLFPTQRHREPMLSLDKAYTEAELRVFDTRVTKTLGVANGSVTYVLEPKFDGLAVSLTYERGRLVRALTRGNGTEGDDVTTNVLQIRDVPRELQAIERGRVPELVEVRGEVYVPFAEFEQVNAERELAGQPRFANPRALAAGTLRQLDAREVARRGLRFVAFGLGACVPVSVLPATQRELPGAFATWGLPAIQHVWTAHGIKELTGALAQLAAAREGFGYPTDGAVVKVDPLAAQRELGTSETAPQWAIAFKFASLRVETQVRAIALQVGRTGVVTPVAELVPVQLGGSTIARATLHNAAEIARHDVRVGDFVHLEKAGEIIPAIVGVNLGRRPPTTACPTCRAALVQREGEVAVRCPNRACAAQLRRQLEHFASPAALEIDGLGPVAIEALVASGRVHALADLYRLRRADFLLLPRSSEKSVDRLLAALERSKRAELWRVIHGLGVPHVGAVAARDLARTHRDLTALAAADERFREPARDLLAVEFTPTPPPAANARLAGKIFVLTGTLPTLSRAQATAAIESAGGKVAANVTRTTSFLVVGTEPGAKLAQARTFGVTLLDEAALQRMLVEE